MRPNIFEVNYALLCTLLRCKPEEMEFDRVYRFRSSGFMDLVVERLPNCSTTGAPVLSLCHYFEQNGDLCKDPEMTLRAFKPANLPYGMLDALTFEQSIPPIYQEVYPEPMKVRPKLKEQLNSFLRDWLRNLISQGHRLVPPETAETAET